MKKLLVILSVCLLLAPRVFSQDFFKLVQSGTAEQVQAAIAAGSSVYGVTKGDDSPLMLAAKYNQNAEVITVLLKAGASVDRKNKYGGKTALMYAATSNMNPGVIAVLLKAGANGKLKSSDDKTAFDYADGNDKLKGTEAYNALRKAAGK